MAPAHHPCVTGHGKTLQEALQHLLDQLILGPQNYTAVYDAHSQRNGIAPLKIPDTTLLGVTMPTFTQSHNSRPGLSTALPSVSVYGSQVLQTARASSAKYIPKKLQSSTDSKTSLRDSKVTSSGLDTSTAHSDIQPPYLGSDSRAKPAHSTFAELLNVEQTAQSGVKAASRTLLIPEASAGAATTASSFANFMPGSTASLGAKVASATKRSKDQDEQREMMSRWIMDEWLFGDLPEELQNNFDFLSSYEYQNSKPKIELPKPHNFASRVYPFGGAGSSIARTFTSPGPNLQAAEPFHASNAFDSASTKALVPSPQFSHTAASLSHSVQTKDDIPRLPAAAISAPVSRSRPMKRKHDDASYGALSFDPGQQIEKIKIEEQSKMIKVEEQLPKKIKLEDLN